LKKSKSRAQEKKNKVDGWPEAEEPMSHVLVKARQPHLNKINAPGGEATTKTAIGKKRVGADQRMVQTGLYFHDQDRIQIV